MESLTPVESLEEPRDLQIASNSSNMMMCLVEKMSITAADGHDAQQCEKKKSKKTQESRRRNENGYNNCLFLLYKIEKKIM